MRRRNSWQARARHSESFDGLEEDKTALLDEGDCFLFAAQASIDCQSKCLVAVGLNLFDSERHRQNGS